MATLKQDLDEYMLMNEERKSSNYKFNLNLPKMPSFLASNSENTSSNSWLNDGNDDGWCPKMNRIQRIAACIVCLGLGIFCFVVSTFYIPVLLFKARKFVLLFSMGSALIIASISFMVGFKSMLSSMFSKQKLAVSVYALSLILTLYFALLAQSTALTVMFAVSQIISLCFLLFGSLPKGSGTGFKLFGSIFKSQVSSLPI